LDKVANPPKKFTSSQSDATKTLFSSQYQQEIKSAIIDLKELSPKSYSKIVKLFGHFYGLKGNSGCMSIIIA
jgi:hypothetical protein